MADTTAPQDPMPELTTIGDWTGTLPQDRDPATRRHRRHQGEWRAKTLRWPAGPPQRDARVRARYGTLPNWLAQTHDNQDVCVAGPNLMSDEARTYAQSRLVALDTIDGKAEPDRFWRNLLSSQPLAFSIAGHLQAHQQEAGALLGRMAGLGVSTLQTLEPSSNTLAAHALHGIEAEWFPPRREHTNDKTGADIAACLGLPGGTQTLLTIEVKYTDTFSSAPVLWARYREHLEHLGLEEETTKDLVAAGCSQVLRQVMMTNSVKRLGITPDAGPQVDSAIAVVLARHDDEKAETVAKTLHAAVGSIVPVMFWSHSDLFEQAVQVPLLSEWARRMRARYVID